MFATEYTEVIAEEPWRVQARCADGTSALVDLFFSEQLDDILHAKAFCRECPVRTECLDAAIARREPWGVWGGELFANGKVLAQKRRRGRPPKVAPPEPVIDELVPMYVEKSESVHDARPPEHRAWRTGVTTAGAHLPPVPQRAPVRRGRWTRSGAQRGQVPWLPFRAFSSAGRAPPLQGGGRGIETLNAHDKSAGHESPETCRSRPARVPDPGRGAACSTRGGPRRLQDRSET